MLSRSLCIKVNDGSVTNAAETGGESLDEKIERLKKEGGYGYFTYDGLGRLNGVAFQAPDVLIPSNDEVG